MVLNLSLNKYQQYVLSFLFKVAVFLPIPLLLFFVNSSKSNPFLASYFSTQLYDYELLIILAVIAVCFIVFEEFIIRHIANIFKIKNLTILNKANGITVFSLATLTLTLYNFPMWETLWYIIIQKSNLFVMIFVFAISAFGMRESNYFNYIAFKISQASRGDIKRMIMWVLIITSFLTFFTSNDVVILALTPIIMRIFAYARVKDTKIVLLAVFVSANTLSMSLLIGSPTNIIFSLINDVSFLEYLLLMLLPSIFAFLNLYVVFSAILYFKSKWYKSSNTYIVPSLKFSPQRNWRMFIWVTYFIILVFIVAILTSFDYSLWYLALIGIPVPFLIMRFERRLDATIANKENLMMKELPYSILPFGITFFYIAELIVNDPIYTSLIYEYFLQIEQLNQYWKSVSLISTTGVLVNLINNLPAASLIAKSIQSIPFEFADQALVYQSIFIGLNIACIISPIGALSGILWFHILKVENQYLNKGISYSSEIQTIVPRRPDLFLFGGLIFIFLTFSLALNLVAVHWIHEILFFNLFNNYQATEFITIAIACVCIILLLFVYKVRSDNIKLQNIIVFLGITSWISSNQSGKIFWRIFVPILILYILGLLIYILDWQYIEYHQLDLTTINTPVTNDIGGFIMWLVRLFGSGDYEDSQFPLNYFGGIIAGLLPIVALFMILGLYRLSSDTLDHKNVIAIASGSTPEKRIVFFPYNERINTIYIQSKNDNNNIYEDTRAVKLLEYCMTQEQQAIFVLVPTSQVKKNIADWFVEKKNQNRLFNINSVEPQGDSKNRVFDLLKQYSVDSADCIFVLSIFNDFNLKILNSLHGLILDKYLKINSENQINTKNMQQLIKYGRLPQIYTTEQAYNAISSDNRYDRFFVKVFVKPIPDDQQKFESFFTDLKWV